MIQLVPSTETFHWSQLALYIAISGIFIYGYFMYLTHFMAIFYAKFYLYKKCKPHPLSGNGLNSMEKGESGDSALPGVSVIKPLCGVDPNVRENLWSLFHMDYPQYEILFCVADPKDPVCLLVERLIQQHLSSSQVSARLLTGCTRVGVNHKVNNMNQGYLEAKYPLLLISDSGITMRQDTLKDMVQVMQAREHTGLVHQVPYVTWSHANYLSPRFSRSASIKSSSVMELSPNRSSSSSTTSLQEIQEPTSFQTSELGPLMHNENEDHSFVPTPSHSSSMTFGQAVQTVFFGSWHARMYLCAALLGVNCTSGMSCLMRKEALEEAGGLVPFASYLAEDFFISKFMYDNKWRVSLAHQPAWQNSLSPNLSQFHSRLTRWQQLRMMMLPVTTLLEPMTNCIPVVSLLTVAWYLVLPSWIPSPTSVRLVLIVTLLHVMAWIFLDYVLLCNVHPPDEPLMLSTWRFLQAWLYRECYSVPLQIANFFKGSRIHWRDREYRVLCGGLVEEVNPREPHAFSAE